MIQNLLKTRLSSILLLAIVVASMYSCNPNGTLYYGTKWIWKRNLKSPVTVVINPQTDVVLSSSGEGYPEYLDDRMSSEYMELFLKAIRSDLENDPMITIVDYGGDYTINLLQVDLEEHVNEEWGGEDRYEISDCKVYAEYSLVSKTGSVIKEDSVSTQENESLKETEYDDGSFTYVEKSYSISFSNLLKRAADKISSFAETAMAKDQRKKN